jgi:hypothetical protein
VTNKTRKRTFIAHCRLSPREIEMVLAGSLLALVKDKR